MNSQQKETAARIAVGHLHEAANYIKRIPGWNDNEDSDLLEAVARAYDAEEHIRLWCKTEEIELREAMPT